MLLHQRTYHELAAQGELYNMDRHMVDVLDTNNMTPLLWASGYGQSATVEFLLGLGANSNHHSNGGRTALMLAASKGFYHVVRILVSDGANINDVDQYGNTALMYATHQDHALVVQELIRNGANLSITNYSGQTAYGLALARRSKSAQATLELHLVSLLETVKHRH